MRSPSVLKIMNLQNQTCGFLYQERVKSFEENDWPWKDATIQKCIPHKLAMAGLMFLPCSNPAAKCFACDLCIENLTAESDPWNLHVARKPMCPYIKLGKRDFPRDYNYDELADIFIQKQTCFMASHYAFKEIQNQNKLKNLATIENEEVEAQH